MLSIAVKREQRSRDSSQICAQERSTAVHMKDRDGIAEGERKERKGSF
jgi:hypothetical protein